MDEEIETKQSELDKLRSETENTYESIEKINAQADQVSRIGRYNNNGNIETTERQHMVLTNLAREGLYARTKIEKLQMQISDLQDKLDTVMNKFKNLYEKTRDFTIALRLAPDRVKDALRDILSTNEIKTELLRNTPMPPLFNISRPKQREKDHAR
jgi:uncharacterized coiled-coil DUF342 family protein